jgi:ligand-binding sensor domain-containing protein
MNCIIIRKKNGLPAVVLAFMILFYSCQRTEYDLLDPTAAGVWTVYTTADGLPSNQARDIKLDSKNNLWFTFPGYGTAKLDSNKNWTYYRTASTPILSDAVNVLAETVDGKIIFGTSDGLSILTAGTTTNVWTTYIDPVATMNVNAILVASNGWIWVGTTDQGFYVNQGAGYVKNLTTQYKKVNAIEEGPQGNIYIGTDNGIVKWDGTSYSYITALQGLPLNKISSIRLDRKERLWIGTNGGKTVSWIDRKGLHQLNLMTGSDSVFVKDICEDRSGDIWFATFNNGVIRYDGVIPHSYKNKLNGFPQDSVYSIAQDKDGNLWFALYNKGLVKYTLPIKF